MRLLLFFFLLLPVPLSAAIEQHSSAISDIYKCTEPSGHITYTYHLCAPTAQLEVMRLASIDDVQHSVALERLRLLQMQFRDASAQRRARPEHSSPRVQILKEERNERMQCQQAQLQEAEFSRQLRLGCTRQECEKLRNKRAQYQIRIDRFC